MSDKPTTASLQINDAVLVRWAFHNFVKRIIATTDDGRGVIIHGTGGYIVEEHPGEWPRIGSFVKQRRWWSCWLISTWQFVNF